MEEELNKDYYDLNDDEKMIYLIEKHNQAVEFNDMERASYYSNLINELLGKEEK